MKETFSKSINNTLEDTSIKPPVPFLIKYILLLIFHFGHYIAASGYKFFGKTSFPDNWIKFSWTITKWQWLIERDPLIPSTATQTFLTQLVPTHLDKWNDVLYLWWLESINISTHYQNASITSKIIRLQDDRFSFSLGSHSNPSKPNKPPHSYNDIYNSNLLCVLIIMQSHSNSWLLTTCYTQPITLPAFLLLHLLNQTICPPSSLKKALLSSAMDLANQPSVEEGSSLQVHSLQYISLIKKRWLSSLFSF